MSNSLSIGEKIKYVFGALEIAKRNREGRELEIIKSANRMVEQLEAELADKEKQLAEARAEIESLRFMVHNQRCCRNCGNHASWNFDTCGFGENPQDENEGPHCRRNDLKRWRPMEYRREKAALAAERIKKK